MILKPFELKIQDLPKEIELEIPAHASSVELQEILDGVKAQVIYNSRGVEEEVELPTPHVEVVKRDGDTLRLRIAV